MSIKELNQNEMVERLQKTIEKYIQSDENLHAIQRKERFWAGVFYSGCTVMVLVPVVLWILF